MRREYFARAKMEARDSVKFDSRDKWKIIRVKNLTRVIMPSRKIACKMAINDVESSGGSPLLYPRECQAT